MFVAVSTHCFADLEFNQACSQISDLEFDKLEIWLGGAPHLDVADVVADPDSFVNRYRESTRVTPVAITLIRDLEPAGFLALMRVAKGLRITQITVPASPLGTPFNDEIERLRELTRVGTQEGIRVSIKTEVGALTEDPHNAIELCQAVKGLGLTLDPSHYLRQSSPDRALELVYPYTFHVHLRDSTPEELQVQVGLGELDYSKVISHLRRESYSRALSIDFHPELMAGQERALELRKMRMLLESLL